MLTSIKLIGQPRDWVFPVVAPGEGQGAVVRFDGIVRGKSKDKSVLRLEFEAYEPMALRVMEEIVAEARDRWALGNLWYWHRLGTVYPGEPAVTILVESPHRREGFAACMYLIDELKLRVPIWKREVFPDGEEWVTSHP